MEKEHKSKHKVQPPSRPSGNHKIEDKSESVPVIKEIHTETVIEEKKSTTPLSNNQVKTEVLTVKKEVSTSQAEENELGHFPKKVKGSKNKNTHYVIPFYILVIILFGLAFAVGGLFAKIIPHFPFNSSENKDQKAVGIANEIILESSPSNSIKKLTDIAPVLKTLPPEIGAKAYGIFKLEDGEYVQLTNKNPEMTLPMASVTKVMTALVAMEEYDLDKPVVIPEKCVGLNAASVGFRPNDVFSLQDVLYGLLVKSGADAACAIANISNEAEFIGKMNAQAKELGMTSTRFTNSIGLDNSTSHVSNVNDLKILVSQALKYSSFRKIVGTEEINLTSKSPSGATYRIRNTNDLLFSIPGTVGIKTGYTDSAGECLTYLYQNKEDEILIVILGSLDRFGDTSKLLNWAKSEIATN